MTKCYTFFRIILPIALFVVPYLLHANGEPTNGNPLNGGSESPDGHCNPITVAVVNCATKSIDLSAFVSWTGTGLVVPQVATWNTGQVAHKISVIPPGDWSWDPSTTGCEQNHWANTYQQVGTFFTGMVDVLSSGAICAGSNAVLTVETDGYNFPGYTWIPDNPGGSLTPYDVTMPGVYTLLLKDEMGCPFSDAITVAMSPPLSPTVTGPPFMCPEGDTSTLLSNQTWSQYAWNTGDTTKTTMITEPGLYELTVTNNLGCTAVAPYGVQSGAVQAVPISMTAQKFVSVIATPYAL